MMVWICGVMVLVSGIAGLLFLLKRPFNQKMTIQDILGDDFPGDLDRQDKKVPRKRGGASSVTVSY